MIAIELNGCSGGMAEGFRRAGITFTWCFDWDPDACASYEHNLVARSIVRQMQASAEADDRRHETQRLLEAEECA